jgi:hypothetical protein
MDMRLTMLGIQEKGANIIKYFIYNHFESFDFLDEITPGGTTCIYEDIFEWLPLINSDLHINSLL